MRLTVFAFAFLAGCGAAAVAPTNDMGGAVSLDGHLQAGCDVDSDCDDGNKCHVPKCQARVCYQGMVDCSSGGDACNAPMCDPKDGSCGTQPLADGTACNDSAGAAGSCSAGSCVPVPSCYDAMNSSATLNCGDAPTDDTTDASNATTTPTNLIDKYACATDETGPEAAYKMNAAADGDVTVTLSAKAVPTDGGVASGDMKPGEPDLDLIILDGACTGQAACMNPMLPGGGYAGITAGTGKEKVTFHAQAGHSYYVVVDGKAGAIGQYHLSVDGCGACMATAQTTLACNASMPLAGDTSMGKSLLSSYTCGSSTVNAPGNEQAFLFKTSAPVTVHATAQVVNATQPVTLLALPTNAGACDPTSCIGSAATTGSAGALTAKLSFAADPDPAGGTARYWVVVDTPAAADSSYGLELACAPYCSNVNGDTLDCSTRSAPSGANNGAAGSTRDVSAWGPAGKACGGMTNLTGAEYVYLFHKQATTNLPVYRLTLAALGAKHLALVVLDAGASAPTDCLPQKPCANTAPVTIAASATTLASTGTYVSAGPGTSDGGGTGKTAVLDLTTGTTAERYYWVIVDGVNGDRSDFALSIDSGCK